MLLYLCLSLYVGFWKRFRYINFDFISLYILVTRRFLDVVRFQVWTYVCFVSKLFLLHFINLDLVSVFLLFPFLTQLLLTTFTVRRGTIFIDVEPFMLIL